MRLLFEFVPISCQARVNNHSTDVNGILTKKKILDNTSTIAAQYVNLIFVLSLNTCPPVSHTTQ